MSLTDNTGMYMPVAPAGGYGNSFGGGCGDGWWVVLFLFALMGNNGWSNGGNGGTLPYLYNQSTQNEVSRGFADSAIANQVSNLQTSVTNGFNETVEMMYKVVDIIKDIETIHAMKDAGYSYASSYDDGMSYRRDSRGRYSRDSYTMRGNSSRYSRADEKEHMLAQIDEMKRKLEQM